MAVGLGWIPRMNPIEEAFNAPQTEPAMVRSVDDLSGLNGTMVSQTEEKKRKPLAFEIDSEGNVKASGLRYEDLAAIKQRDQMLSQILGSMHLESERLRAREEQARSNPIMGALTAIAGNLAAGDPTLPGWVRGLGRASLQMNPPAEALAAQRMDVLQHEAVIAERTMGAEARVVGLQIAAERAAAAAELAAMKEKNLETKAELLKKASDARQHTLDLKETRLTIAKMTPGMSKDEFLKMIPKGKFEDEEIEALWGNYQGTSKLAADTEARRKERLDELKRHNKETERMRKDAIAWQKEKPPKSSGDVAVWETRVESAKEHVATVEKELTKEKANQTYGLPANVEAVERRLAAAKAKLAIAQKKLSAGTTLSAHEPAPMVSSHGTTEATWKVTEKK